MAIQTQMYPDNLGLPLGGGSQDWFMMDNIHHNNNNNNNNTNDLYNDWIFNFQQKQQQQQQLQQQYLLHLQLQQQQQQQQSLVHLQDLQNQSGTCSTTASCDYKPMNFSQGLAAQLEKQSFEVDTYILSQNERLKVAVQEQTKQQVGALWRKLEAKGMMMVQQKDKEIAKATERRRELEESMRKVEAEKEVWKRLALENESMVLYLNNTLEQVKEQACFNSFSNDVVNDAESCCDNKESLQVEMEMKMCRVCKCREASVLLLPCRHLCCCIACHAFLDACPLCHSLKKASIQALFS